MTAEEIRELVQRQAFDPFTIHMNDGSRLKVWQPDNFFMPRTRKFGAIVAHEGGGGRFSIIALGNIAHISTRGSWPKMRGRKRKNGSSGEEE